VRQLVTVETVTPITPIEYAGAIEVARGYLVMKKGQVPVGGEVYIFEVDSHVPPTGPPLRVPETIILRGTTSTSVLLRWQPHLLAALFLWIASGAAAGSRL
jgi:hypothetical protein